MMPHQACSQHGCWLERFAAIEAVPFPKFQLFQAVKRDWFDEEEKRWRCDRGQVVGLMFNSPEFTEPGWSYWVRVTETECDWLPDDFAESSHESELAADT